MNIITTINITKNYASHRALNKLNISIPENTIFGLLGPNGAGKTSFIRILTQIIAPDEGEVLFHNQKLAPVHISQTGYLPEERGLYKKMKIGEQLIYLARLKGLSHKPAKEKVKVWMEKMNLLSWTDKNVEDLSKGMQQKVQFIAAVISEPSLIILDEPFTGFDPINAELVKQEILNLKKRGATIILSTHRMESVEELCDHIALIHKSEKILDGSVSAIKHEFKTGTYIIEGSGKIVVSDKIKILSQEKLNEVKSRYRLRAEGIKSNDLLHMLMKGLEIDSFKEEEPSIGDIFISKVKGVSHE